MSRRIYAQGEPITDPVQAFAAIMRREWLIMRGKPVHPAWAGGWPSAMLATYARNGLLYRAVLTPYGERITAARAAAQAIEEAA